jgi:O-antigen/teichoic acid export membrane protein
MRIFGPGFNGNGTVVVVNLAAGGLMLASAPLVYWLASVGRQWAVARSNAVWAAVYGVTAWFAISRGWAALGVASASLFAYTVQTGYYVWVFRRARIQELTL